MSVAENLSGRPVRKSSIQHAWLRCRRREARVELVVAGAVPGTPWHCSFPKQFGDGARSPRGAGQADLRGLPGVGSLPRPCVERARGLECVGARQHRTNGVCSTSRTRSDRRVGHSALGAQVPRASLRQASGLEFSSRGWYCVTASAASEVSWRSVGEQGLEIPRLRRRWGRSCQNGRGQRSASVVHGGLSMTTYAVPADPPSTCVPQCVVPGRRFAHPESVPLRRGRRY